MLLCLANAACEQSSPPKDKLVIGEPLPNVTLVALDGATQQLSELRGKLLVLNFWATWCAACRWEMPYLQTLDQSLDDNHFVVIGLAGENDEHVVREYLLDKGVSFPNFIDRKQQIAMEQFGIQVFPYTLIVAQDGRLIERIAGPRMWNEPDIRSAIEKAYVGDWAEIREIAANPPY